MKWLTMLICTFACTAVAQEETTTVNSVGTDYLQVVCGETFITFLHQGGAATFDDTLQLVTVAKADILRVSWIFSDDGSLAVGAVVMANPFGDTPVYASLVPDAFNQFVDCLD
ncbi:MAG: hypothetical protein F4181_06010 [Proteobacteria bacterium]|nr:hypothetical protein [Pseudomonadota bacterium]